MEDDDDMRTILRTGRMRNFSVEILANRSSRDFLQMFVGSKIGCEEVKEDEEIEMNLGLSLGGRFGVDKTSKKLVRSSSIAECLPLVRDENDSVAPPVAYTGLVRTSSLPAETEEEWRKRKELQMLRRLEAKRRRSEKQRNLKVDKDAAGDGGAMVAGNLSLEEKREIEVNLRKRLHKEKFLAASKKFDSSLGPPFQFMKATNEAQKAKNGALTDLETMKGRGSHLGGGIGIQDFGQLGSQGAESKGGSSLSLSELDDKTLQGSSSGGEHSPSSIQSLQEVSNQSLNCLGTKARENTSRKAGEDVKRNGGRETGMSMTQDMPCVFTRGDGPNGRRVDGILYKYGKGEEVRIMCICHGSFLSPVEFIKHAGGNEVDQPLKHIVVNPNSSSLL